MRKGLGAALVVLAVLVAIGGAYKAFNVSYLLAPSKDKFMETWSSDVKLLEQSGKLPKAWQAIREIKVRTDNSPAQNWIVGVEPPIHKKTDGTFRLDVFITHWIEGDRYGAVLQYNLVDLTTGNTVWELGRTFRLGYIL